ncbi:MAG: isopentenyl phosphate kinase family protein [Anaerolineae bacterium]|nr:isopentenyl phosphate kinase family protein [Anaerolineae bacterium]
MTEELVFIKLGGSLITNKRKEATPRINTLCRLARELRVALDANPALKIVLGHGSGSFGHWEASKYGTRAGVQSPGGWYGFAEVSAAALRLNRIVIDTFLGARVPVLSLQPAASALTEDHRIIALSDTHIRLALDHGVIPLVFGDVAFDSVLGGTILSTEDLFFYLVERLHPSRVLLLGNAPGVLDDAQQVVPVITPGSFPTVKAFLQGSSYTDVTGGMAGKVETMVTLVQRMPGLCVWILTGRDPDNLRRALLEPENTPGTCIMTPG